MTGVVPGIGGTLLPDRYIATELPGDARELGAATLEGALARRLIAWWTTVERSTGPATPIREVFDRVAMPLCALLGFTAHDARFDGRLCRARLATRRSTPVALLVAPWAERPSARWATLAAHAHELGAAWGLVLAPPFLSLVPTRGHAVRHGVDISLAAALPSASFGCVFPLLQAASFDATTGGPPPIDGIVARAARFQDAVRDDLQCGVESSLRALQPAIARSRRDSQRRSAVARGSSAFDEALTLVYRVLFLLFAESRRLVPADARVYRDAYAVSRFCLAAVEGDDTGLWDALAATSRMSRLGCHTDEVDVSPFNGPLFARAAAPSLERRQRGTTRRRDARERDDAVRHTLVALGTRRDRTGREAIDYRDLGVEQLGAVYERVLDLEHDPTTPARPRASRQHSRVRKQTGTFYTPQPLADFVVRRTLAPLTDGASSDDVLSIRVLDPAMGSGAFLVAACRFLAQAYQDALVAEGAIAAADIDEDARAGMRRLIAERCLWGVDRNPTAVHLARLSLWLTALARDKPLNFLDHRLRTGDSLVGAWPSDLQRLAMRRPRAAHVMPLFEAAAIDDSMRLAMRPLWSLLATRDDTVADVHAREAHWRRFQASSSPLQRWRQAAHLWCARWFIDGPPSPAEMRALVAALLRGDHTLDASHVAMRARGADAAATARGFFHWPLEFPDVFHAEDGRPLAAPGFDAVIGNPPWEMVRRDAGTPAAEGALVRYVRQSGQYPSCTSGHLNLYQAFVDRAIALARAGGRIGFVLPWGLATDDGAAALRARLLRETALDAVVGLDNAAGLFPIHRGLRFLAITTTTGRATDRFHARLGVKTRAELDDLPARGACPAGGLRFTSDLLRQTSGASMRIPDARRRGDVDLLASLTRRFPALGHTQGWGVSFGRELNATDARPHVSMRGIPIVEGKHLSPFVVDSSAATHLDPAALTRLMQANRITRARVGYRDVSGVGNRFTLIAAVVPPGVVTTHTVFCLREHFDTTRQHFLCALLNSYVLNWIVRLLMGGHVTTGIVENLPGPRWTGDARDLEIAGLAEALADNRASALDAARLQALVAHRFELTAGEFRHVADGFPLVDARHRTEALRQFDDIGRGPFLAHNRQS